MDETKGRKRRKEEGMGGEDRREEKKRRKVEWNGRGCEERKGQEKVLGKERKQYDTIRYEMLF